MSRSLLGPLLAGAGTALLFWGGDAAALRQLQFAGVSDPAAQERLLAATRFSILHLEARLVLLHASMGALLGLLAYLVRPRRPALLAAGLVVAVQALAVLAMMGRYPQLYADRWWLGGGLRAEVLRFTTHTVGPRPFEGVLLGLVGAGLLLALWRATPGARAVLLALLVPAGLLTTPFPGRWHRSPGGRPSVLLLVSDSLRADRLESPDVMPFHAGLLPEGTLFRHAFTPVARTVPSWVSLLTGLEPRHTGVRTMFPRPEDRQDIGPTFVSELRDDGYRTFVVADFAGDMFPRIGGGFQVVDTPNLTADTLARSVVLAAHSASLPALRLGWGRDLLPEWRNLASLSDPEWLVDRAISQIRAAGDRPFVGVVFFGTSHFPYVAPWPDYLRQAGDYRGPYLYHAPPAAAGLATAPDDVAQIRARYDGSLHAIDRATRRLVGYLGEHGLADTLLAVTGDHGEDLYEEPGIAGHGDVIGLEHSQAVPLLLVGSRVPAGRVSAAQVRLTDLAATILALLGPGTETFGDGRNLLGQPGPRPLCVETGIWFFPGQPAGLRGRRLLYPGVAELLELEPATREFVLRRDRTALVESAKQRGVVLGHRAWLEGLTPEGRVAALHTIPGVDEAASDVDLGALFQERCVSGDPHLDRFLGSVVWRP